MLRRIVFSLATLVLVDFSLALPLAAQSKPVTPPVTAPANTALVSALSGDWTGVLEYRDYSEPAGSTKRVQLPIWLSISQGPGGLLFHYVYDDGPNKILEETSVIVIDEKAKTYSETSSDHVVSVSTVSGLEKLKDGRGELILLGAGKDNDKPAEMRMTLTMRRNLLIELEEVRPAGSTDAFTFRHRYVFTRANAPKVTAPR